MFKTPVNIDSLTEEEILQLVPDRVVNMRGTREGRLKLIKLIYAVLGFDLPNELLLIQLAEDPAFAVIATAGAGKTTLVQAKILLEKLLRISPITKAPIKGEKILCLVYNTHNVKQLQNKQAQFVNRLKSCGAQGINIDSDVNATTMHSFCQAWIMQYTARCNLLNHKLITEADATKMLSNCIKSLERRKGKDYSADTISNILKLYNVLKESLCKYENMDTLEAYSGMLTPKEDLIELFNAYDNTKSFRSCYDFSDMLIKFHKLLVEDEEARTYIQNYYHYITADEVQDFTPVMMEILQLIKGKHVPLICIGDEDQSIYSFRGADIYNTLDFENKFEGGVVYSLSTNRRCGANILKPAKKIIETNTLRFDKNIDAIREGGRVDFIPYSTADGQLINLCNKIRKFTESELQETIICYRNKKSSLLLADMLEKERIPFNVISGYLPFEHELYKHVFDVIGILYRPYDREFLLNLYKVMPISKGELYSVLGYDPAKRKWKTDNELKHFAAYDYGKYNESVIFVKELQNLLLISKGVQEFPLNTYFDKLFLRIKKYFWNYKMEINKDEELDNYYTAEVYKFFNVDIPFNLLESDYMKRKRLCKLNNISGSGVTLSTFHGLKGLEYDNVFVIDLEDSIFPNYAAIDDCKGLSDSARLNLKECETRLFYVAMTRAKKHLYLYYNESNPSIYIKLLKDNMQIINKPEVKSVDTNTLDIMNVFTNEDIASSPNNFIDVELENDSTEELALDFDEEEDEEIELHFEEDEEDEDEEIELHFEEDLVEGNNKEEIVGSSEPERIEEVKYYVPKEDMFKKEEDEHSEKNNNENENNDSSTDYQDFLTMTLDRL